MGIQFIDLIHTDITPLSDMKIHLAQAPRDSPLTAFLNGEFQAWQEFQTKQNFGRKFVLSLIKIKGDKWLFAGIWQVHGCKQKTIKGKTRYIYSTSELDAYKPFSGRVIVSFKRKDRASYRLAETIADQLELSQILEEAYSIAEFPGYSAVLLKYAELKHIVSRELSAWHAALASVSGVYVITDTKTGQHYIGSAYGANGIWGRWSEYAHNGHGGNRDLRLLIKSKGIKYADNYQFAILEIADRMASEIDVINREAHWKRVLYAREFGMNAN